ncbi:MAG: right-handed parallel beta-helix repeat-containing protein [Planctomycetaceae bacterium]|nr:right-handed parallel beta-helix repeat-containing protein [Planctomycetaceae bacterium]
MLNRVCCAFGLTFAFSALQAWSDELPIMPVGWAAVADSQNGTGTTGGSGGRMVTVTDAESLVAAALQTDAQTILISGRIELTKSVRIGSNTTLRGLGPNAALAGGGLHLRRVQNVVIQNLTITGGSDAVSIEESHHVWVDHCDLSRCRDGLLDIKRGSDFITVSWNRFHDRHKTCLLGHSDKADIRKLDTGHLRVTYHHNFFDGTKTRHPRVRFADGVHVFNNYFRGNEYGVASLMDAGVIVESNVFEDVEHPTLIQYGDSPDPGRLTARNNLLLESGALETRGEVDQKQLLYRYIIDPPEQIAELVSGGAGVQDVSPPSGTSAE